MRRLYQQDGNSIKLVIIWLVVVVLITCLGIGAFFLSSTYFYKDQPSKGYVEFAPGIYLEFNEETVLIDENNPQNWKLLYYVDNDTSKDPVEFNTKNESTPPIGKTYLLESPAFRSAKNDNGEAAPFVARAKLEYLDQNGNKISDEVFNAIFSQDFTDVEIAEGKAGKPLEFERGWVLGNGGYYYYVGEYDENGNPILDKDGDLFEIDSTTQYPTAVKRDPRVDDLKKIEYSKYAQYINILKTEKDGYAYFRLANITIENYEGEFNLTEIKVVLTMEFAEHLSSISRDWFNK